MKEQTQTLLFSEAPASLSPSPESDSEWIALVATWPSSPLELLTKFARNGFFLKTSLDSLVQMGDGTLASSSQQWGNAGMGGPTGLSMHSFSDWPSDGSACSLSDILEDNGSVPRRYYLSAKACAGILRRAERRGKELPTELRRALEAVAQAQPEPVTAEEKIE